MLGAYARIDELNIALDASYSLGENLSGVGVYSRELMHGLLAEAPGVEWSWAYRPQHWRQVCCGASPPGVNRRFLWENRLPARCDLFHGLGQRLPGVFDKLPRRVRTVATFHDLFVLTADYSSAEFRARMIGQARQAAKRADAVIAVSRFTAGQVETLLGVEARRIHVVPHGVRPLAMPAVARERMILSVGALQVRKNTVALVRAFEQLPPGWRLVLAGSTGHGYEETIKPAIKASSRRADIVLPGWVDDSALGRLYARAWAFAFPSLDEGFGIPVLEAMAAGVPVLASNTSSLPEVCGDAALLVDPHDVGAIAAGLSRLIDEESLRTELIERGKRRAAEFTWERCARSTWEVYQSLRG